MMSFSLEQWQVATISLSHVAAALLTGVLVLRIKIEHLRLTRLWQAGLLFLLSALLADIWLTTAIFTDVELANVWPQIPLMLQQTQVGQAFIVSLVAWLSLVIASYSKQHLRTGLLTLGFIGLVWAKAASGHAGDEGRFSSAVLIHALHLLAAWTWLGLILAWVGVGVKAAQGKMAALGQHLSEVATICLLTLLCSGLADVLRLLEHVPHKMALLSSYYAQWLGAKLALVSVAVALGGLNRWRYLPALQAETTTAAQQFYRIAIVESLFLITVILCASQLGTMMPE